MDVNKVESGKFAGVVSAALSAREPAGVPQAIAYYDAILKLIEVSLMQTSLCSHDTPLSFEKLVGIQFRTN